MMKIGIDITSVSGWRGPSRNVKNLIRALAELGHKHQYFWYHPYPLDNVVGDLKNVADIYIPIRKNIPWLNVSLPIEAKKHKLDLFIFPGSDFWYWHPMKTIVFTRTYAIVSWGDSLMERMRAKIKKARLKHVADKVCAVSGYNAEQISINCGVDKNKIEIVYNAVDPSFLKASVSKTNKYGDYILYCGGTEKLKNIDGLIKAYSLLAKRGVKEKLVLVGDRFSLIGSGMTSYLELAKKLEVADKIVIHGIEKNPEKLASIYKGAKAVVFPSFQESFGMVSVEAMACGAPLVASNVTAIPEVAGDAAVYFDPYDSQDMANKIATVLNNEKLRHELIVRGYDRIKEFTWMKSASKMLDIIEKVNNIK